MSSISWENIKLPVQPPFILEHFHNHLSPYELKEVSNYKDIYYISDLAHKVNAYTKPDFIDSNGFYRIRIGDHISYRYEIKQYLGSGTYGHVVKAFDHKEKQLKAIKIIKAEFFETGEEEAKTLLRLKNLKAAQNNIIELKTFFRFRSQMCLVFDCYETTLRGMMEKGVFKTDPSKLRDFTQKILNALKLLKTDHLIHGDLKPENVMYNQAGDDLRLIDFGLACSELAELDWVVQTRYYRAPEVLLGLPYTTSIDMWSLGCLICTLILGGPIFKGASSHDQVLAIIEVLGLPPKHMVERAANKVQIFNEDLTLKPVDEEGKLIRKLNFKDLGTVLKTGDQRLIDFLRACFEYDPTDRLTPEMALKHPWITKCDMDEEVHQVPWESKKGMYDLIEEELPAVKSVRMMMDEVKSTMDSSCNVKATNSGLSLSNKGSHEYLEPVLVSSAKKM